MQSPWQIVYDKNKEGILGTKKNRPYLSLSAFLDDFYDVCDVFSYDGYV